MPSVEKGKIPEETAKVCKELDCNLLFFNAQNEQTFYQTQLYLDNHPVLHINEIRRDFSTVIPDNCPQQDIFFPC